MKSTKRVREKVVQNQMSKECVDMMCESLLLIQSRAVLTFYNIITNILIYNYFHNRMLAHHLMFFCTLTFLSLLIVMKPSRVSRSMKGSSSVQENMDMTHVMETAVVPW